jgi:hypothetical protein
LKASPFAADRRGWAAMVFPCGVAELFGRCAAASACIGRRRRRATRRECQPSRRTKVAKFKKTAMSRNGFMSNIPTSV